MVKAKIFTSLLKPDAVFTFTSKTLQHLNLRKWTNLDGVKSTESSERFKKTEQVKQFV